MPGLHRNGEQPQDSPQATTHRWLRALIWIKRTSSRPARGRHHEIREAAAAAGQPTVALRRRSVAMQIQKKRRRPNELPEFRNKPEVIDWAPDLIVPAQ